MYDVAKAGNTLLVCYRDRSKSTPVVSRSTDGGKNWKDAEVDKVRGYPRLMAVDPNNDDVIYVCGYNIYANSRNKERAGFVHKSTDGGAHWKSVFETTETNYVYSVFVDPMNAGNVYFGSNFGIFKSTDSGKTWEKITSDRCESIYVTKKGTIYALCADGVIRSTDGGGTWNVIIKHKKSWWPMRTQSTTFHFLKIDEKNNRLYVATEAGLLRLNL